MSKIQLGYACINMELSDVPKKQRVTTNRSMIKRTFKAKGIQYASELAELNTRDILPILMWNQRHNVKVFRMSSCLFPWASEYMLEDLPAWETIAHNLKRAGDYAKENGILAIPNYLGNLLVSDEVVVVSDSEEYSSAEEEK